MKWFMVLNSGADQWFIDMVKVAVHTARQHTRLEPHVIYDGGTTELSGWLTANGVTVHRFRVPFYDRLSSPDVTAANHGSHYSPNNASGIYLKLFISDFCEPGEPFLFTDCDVMFTGDFSDELVSSQGGGFWAVNEGRSPPEIGNTDSNFNSGVFVSDQGTFAEFRKVFLDCLEANKYFFWGKPGFYDQGLLNIIMKPIWRQLDPRLNWRPFWGVDARPMIWHYHGAKPIQIQRILTGKPDRIDHDDVIGLVSEHRFAYGELLGRFQAALASVNQTETANVKPIKDICSFEFNGSVVSPDTAYGLGYLEDFKRIVELYNPREVLEWGAGMTTLLLAHLVRGRIVSIDDNETYLKAVCIAAPAIADLEAYACSRMGLGRGQADPELHYASFPATLGRLFDFIYIDGRRRVECGLHAMLCCTPDAKIVVHDFRRTRYHALLALYDVVLETKQFRVLTPNPAVREAIINRYASATSLSPLIDGVSVKQVR